MPRPPARRSSGRSPCTNRSKTCGSSDASMPSPRSQTSSSAREPSRRRCTRTSRPAGVYLKALPSRLVSTCSMRVASASAHTASSLQAQRVALRFAGDVERRADVAHQRRQIERPALQQHLAGDDAADVEQVVHQPRQVPRLAGDDLPRVGGQRGIALHALQHFDGRGDRAQRVAQLVAEHGQELVLGAAGCFGLLARFALAGHQRRAFMLGVLAFGDVHHRRHRGAAAPGLVEQRRGPHQHMARRPAAVAQLELDRAHRLALRRGALQRLFVQRQRQAMLKDADGRQAAGHRRRRADQRIHRRVVNHRALRRLAAHRGKSQTDRRAVEEGFEVVGLALQCRPRRGLAASRAGQRLLQLRDLAHHRRGGQRIAGRHQLAQRFGDPARHQGGQRQAEQQAGGAGGQRGECGPALRAVERRGGHGGIDRPARDRQRLPGGIRRAAVDELTAVRAPGLPGHRFDGGWRQRLADAARQMRARDDAVVAAVEAEKAARRRAAGLRQRLPMRAVDPRPEPIACASAMNGNSMAVPARPSACSRSEMRDVPAPFASVGGRPPSPL